MGGSWLKIYAGAATQYRWDLTGSEKANEPTAAETQQPYRPLWVAAQVDRYLRGAAARELVAVFATLVVHPGDGEDGRHRDEGHGKEHRPAPRPVERARFAHSCDCALPVPRFNREGSNGISPCID